MAELEIYANSFFGGGVLYADCSSAQPHLVWPESLLSLAKSSPPCFLFSTSYIANSPWTLSMIEVFDRVIIGLNSVVYGRKLFICEVLDFCGFFGRATTSISCFFGASD